MLAPCTLVVRQMLGSRDQPPLPVSPTRDLPPPSGWNHEPTLFLHDAVSTRASPHVYSYAGCAIGLLVICTELRTDLQHSTRYRLITWWPLPRLVSAPCAGSSIPPRESTDSLVAVLARCACRALITCWRSAAACPSLKSSCQRKRCPKAVSEARRTQKPKLTCIQIGMPPMSSSCGGRGRG